MYRVTATDYALRATAYLAESCRIASSYEISREAGIDRQYLFQLLKPLVRAGVVEGMHGRRGGYRLSADPSSVRVLEVLAAVAPKGRVGSEPECGMTRTLVKIEEEACDVTVAKLMGMAAAEGYPEPWKPVAR